MLTAEVGTSSPTALTTVGASAPLLALLALLPADGGGAAAAAALTRAYLGALLILAGVRVFRRQTLTKYIRLVPSWLPGHPHSYVCSSGMMSVLVGAALCAGWPWAGVARRSGWAAALLLAAHVPAHVQDVVLAAGRGVGAAAAAKKPPPAGGAAAGAHPPPSPEMLKPALLRLALQLSLVGCAYKLATAAAY